MKKFLFVALGLLALPSVASAIEINAGGAQPTWTFDTAPLPSDFATGSIAGAGNTIGDDATFNSTIAPTTSASYASAVGTSATNPPTSTNATFRHNTTGLFLQSAPTGNAFAGLKATLHNNTPNYITDLAVAFDLGATLAEAGTDGPMPGYRIYYSTTGAANSWTPVGNFSTAGPVNFNISGLGTSFPDNLYLVWGDDNANGGTEGQYQIDNVTFNATLGGPKVIIPPTPDYGTQLPPASNDITGGSLNLTSSGGTVVNQADGPGGAANDTYRVNNSAVDILSELVDLRTTPAGPFTRTASIDLKTWEDSAGSDFETGDNIHVTVEWSSDGLTFNSVDLVPTLVGGAATADPADQLKPLDTGELGAYAHYSIPVPDLANTARIHVTGVNNSASERFFFDNLAIITAPVPEPASVAMIGLGLIGLVGYGVRRRRSA
jgi:hypothetical protein